MLKTVAEELYTMRKFIRAMKTRESQNKKSQFVTKFKQVEDRINAVRGHIGQLVSVKRNKT